MINILKNPSITILLAALWANQLAFAQREVLEPDLSAINDPNIWGNYDRKVSYDSTLNFQAKESEGPVWLKDFEFGNGTIEVDIRGKDIQGQSFVGVAFHLLDPTNFEAVYFRPFNFLNPERSGHSIQYIAMPMHPWQQLREDFPGKYENNIPEPPNPDDWFHVALEIHYPMVRVFVNHEKVPSLEIDSLSEQKTGSVGLWVGYMSEGKFRNLKITTQ